MTKEHLCCVFTLILFFALPVTGIPYQERLIFSTEQGGCSLHVEADDQSHTLRLRILPEPPACYFTREMMRSVLKAAFHKSNPAKLEGVYSSLYLGRLIDYPWLSEYLAVTAYKDQRWEKKKGKPRSMDINKYVSAILSSKEVTNQFEEAFADSGYRAISASVEKVLVGRFRDVPLYQGKMLYGGVPFDAQVWLRLEKK